MGEIQQSFLHPLESFPVVSLTESLLWTCPLPLRNPSQCSDSCKNHSIKCRSLWVLSVQLLVLHTFNKNLSGQKIVPLILVLQSGAKDRVYLTLSLPGILSAQNYNLHPIRVQGSFPPAWWKFWEYKIMQGGKGWDSYFTLPARHQNWWMPIAAFRRGG